MHGNIWNWCLDTYGEYAKPQGGRAVEDNEIEEDINSISILNRRVTRGGSFFYHAVIIRSASRVNTTPAEPSIDAGFRPARTFTP
jgi:formylglycine-generating enzyme required for sulfatase activity